MLNYIWHFQCSVDTRNRVKWTRYWEKVFWCSILFQPNLANLQPVAALTSTVGKPSSCGPQTTFTVNHKPQSNFYEGFKGFVEVTLYNIIKWDVSGLEVIRCSALSDKITNWPKTTRKTEICKYWFYMNEDLYVDITCMNDLCTPWYKLGVGKNWFKNLQYSLCITLIQDCVNSSAFDMELLQTCAKPLIWSIYGPGHEGAAVLLPGFATI